MSGVSPCEHRLAQFCATTVRQWRVPAALEVARPALAPTRVYVCDAIRVELTLTSLQAQYKFSGYKNTCTYSICLQTCGTTFLIIPFLFPSFFHFRVSSV